MTILVTTCYSIKQLFRIVDDKFKRFISSGAEVIWVKPFEPSLLKTSRLQKYFPSKNKKFIFFFFFPPTALWSLKNKIFRGEVESEVTTLTHSPADADFMEKLTKFELQDDMGNLELNTNFLCPRIGV